ncbi:fluoride efflux transporter FluC [Microbacterium sp. A196]|uniref:fluoride efflux transporter FluC n=1 Tax=unclassified Microbacterium TaxID=2609290 RepID=UPI003FCFDC72
MNLRRLLLVILGGMLGTAGRLGIELLLPNSGGFPFATLIANGLGALLIGILASRPFGELRDRGRDARLFLGTGILGGFTTYSAFAVGSVGLWVDSPFAAVVYVVLTLGLGIGAAALGLNRRRSRAGGAE